jgi:hypothetical protein
VRQPAHERGSSQFIRNQEMLCSILIEAGCAGLAKLTKRDALGAALLFLSGFMMMAAGIQLTVNWVVQFWLAEAITQYLGLAASLSNEIQRFVFSLSTTLTIAGGSVILGTVIWFASPPRPHGGTDWTLIAGKIVVCFGVSVATLALATILFGVWATLSLSSAGFQTEWLIHVPPYLGFQLGGLITAGTGSVLFAGFRHRSR